MSTLTEIEAAVDALTPEQQEALLKYLTERAAQRGASPAGKSHNLADFSGTVRLHEEPLVWQSAARDEWR